jgi:hypothetical protein
MANVTSCVAPPFEADADGELTGLSLVSRTPHLSVSWSSVFMQQEA